MPDVLQVIRSRRSYRAISPEPISEEVLERVLTAASLAPSCFNNQPWRFLVARSPEALETMRARLSGGNYWATQAPVLVAVVTRADLDCKLADGERHYAEFDTGMAVMSLLLQAEAEGLYAHPMAGFRSVQTAEAFDIPEDYKVLTLVALGYPGDIAQLSEKHAATERSERTRKPVDEIACYDEWRL